MTNTEQTADYQKAIRVRAQPAALFDALTTAAGLSAWWTDTTGSGTAGGELGFTFNSPDPCVMHVDEATPTSVRWTVTECGIVPDWVGTRLAFTITQVDGDTSEVLFRHHGLTAELDCIADCTRGWNHYLESLRRYAEVGRGMPRGSSEDMSRRG
jgi:uncharacterized protein YndB with AHSA1/START domain